MLVPLTQTSLKRNEGIEVIWRHYEDHYEHNLPIPTIDLRSFKFNERYFTQTPCVAMGTTGNPGSLFVSCTGFKTRVNTENIWGEV